MTATETVIEQLSDPFRIGLLVALVATMLRTQTATGTWLPLAAGVVFVAVIIPMTLAPVADGGMVAAVGYGIIANTILLAVIMAGLALWRRLRSHGE